MGQSDSNLLRVECFNCGKVMSASNAMRGKYGSCPRCGSRIRIPELEPQPTPLVRKVVPAESKPAKSEPALERPPARPTIATRNAKRRIADICSGVQILESRAVVAIWLLRTTMLVTAIHCFIFWMLYEQGQRGSTLGRVQVGVFFVQLGMTMVTAVFFLRWKYQASANLQVACKEPLEFSPGWSCGLYFIPIWNFFKPCSAMSEIQFRSKAGVGVVTFVWWGLWITSIAILNVILKNVDNPRYDRFCLISIQAICASIISGFFLLRVIKAVTQKQRQYRLAIQSDVAPTSLLSIEQWEDSEPAKGSWLDNPLVGTLGVILAVACLFSWGALQQGLAAGAETANSGDTGIEEILTGLDQDPFSQQSINYLTVAANYDPSQKDAVQDKVMKVLADNPLRLHNQMEIFPIWFDSDDTKRISALLKLEKFQQHAEATTLATVMANMPDSVPAMISEIGKHFPSDNVCLGLKQELTFQNIDSITISRQLATELRTTVDPQKFEKLALNLGAMSWDTLRVPELKKLIATSMAAGGRNLKPDQIEKMDKNITDAILKFALLPESADLLEKLATTSEGSRDVASFLSRDKSEEASKLAIKLVKEDKINSRILSGDLLKSVAGYELLWEGKLARKKGFLNKSIPLSDASMKAFSNVAAAMIETDPRNAIDALSKVLFKRGEFDANLLSDEFKQKVDAALASRIKKELGPLAKTSKFNPRKNRKRRKTPISLRVAARFGGKKTALAIAEIGRSNPAGLMEFNQILPVLVQINEPQTHDVIVDAWRKYGQNEQQLLNGTIVYDLEPVFLGLLRAEMKRAQYRTSEMNALIRWIRFFGTSASVPTLEKLTESEFESFNKDSQTAINTIQRRNKKKTRR